MLDEKARFQSAPTHSTEARMPGAGGMEHRDRTERKQFEKAQAGASQEPPETDVL